MSSGSIETLALSEEVAREEGLGSWKASGGAFCLLVLSSAFSLRCQKSFEDLLTSSPNHPNYIIFLRRGIMQLGYRDYRRCHRHCFSISQ
jgi:hypothetical protein